MIVHPLADILPKCRGIDSHRRKDSGNRRDLIPFCNVVQLSRKTVAQKFDETWMVNRKSTHS